MELIQNRSALPWYRKYSFLLSILIGIVAAWILLLPLSGSLNIIGKVLLTLFIFLTMVITAIVLMDSTKSQLVQALFAVFLIAELLYVLFAYSGADFNRIGHVFFNKQVMSGNWHLFIKGLFVTVKIAVFSIVFATLLGILLSVFRIMKVKMITIGNRGFLNLKKNLFG